MSKIQSVIFNKSCWDPKNAEIWLYSHKLRPIKSVHETKNYYRYRIRDPKEFKSFMTKKTMKCLSLIIGFH